MEAVRAEEEDLEVDSPGVALELQVRAEMEATGEVRAAGEEGQAAVSEEELIDEGVHVPAAVASAAEITPTRVVSAEQAEEQELILP